MLAMLLTKRKVVVSIHYQQVETFLWQEIVSHLLTLE
jgi:hypothetical protein